MKKQKMWSKRIRRWIFAALVLSGCLVSAFSAALPVFAYSQAVIATPTPTLAPKKKSGKWVRKKDYFYYYNENGKKLKNGIFQIGKKKYCFDKKGRQLTGWRKIGKRAYYFRYLNGKKGYMLTNRKVDGIKLKKNGRAAPKGARAKQKLPLLIRVQKLSDKAVRPLSLLKVLRCSESGPYQ